MEILAYLGIKSTIGVLGLTLLVIGGFMILAGTGIISIEKITIKKGRATWMIGIGFAIVGLILFYPELAASVDNTTVTQSNEVADEPTQVSVSDQNSSSDLSGAGTLAFEIPDDNLWRVENGRYIATGSKDTYAWSEEQFSGNIEISMDIESSNEPSAANIIVYGNGTSLSEGNLIFTVATDLQAVLVNSIYGDGNYLFSSLNTLDFKDQTHTVLIKIIDRKATMYIDDEKITSVYLDDNINTSGYIGLLKYWEIEDITFSNIQISEPE
jgi:hypothetical protein